MGFRDNPNYKNIVGLMKKRKVRGNPKDFVVIANEMMMDYRSSYRIARTDYRFTRTDIEPENEIILIHKRFLSGFVDKDVVALFWNAKMRVRVIRKLKPVGTKVVKNVSKS